MLAKTLPHASTLTCTSLESWTNTPLLPHCHRPASTGSPPPLSHPQSVPGEALRNPPSGTVPSHSNPQPLSRTYLLAYLPSPPFLLANSCFPSSHPLPVRNPVPIPPFLSTLSLHSHSNSRSSILVHIMQKLAAEHTSLDARPKPTTTPTALSPLSYPLSSIAIPHPLPLPLPLPLLMPITIPIPLPIPTQPRSPSSGLERKLAISYGSDRAYDTGHVSTRLM
jgi:hypothetical protein